MRDPRGHVVLQNLPATSWAELEQLREQHEQLQARRRETGGKLEELRAAHAKIDEQHRADFAAALIAGKPEPPRTALEKIETDIAAAARRSEALVDALGLLEGELAALLAEHRADWKKAAEDEREEARAELATALDTLERSVARLAEVSALVRFVGSPEPVAYRPRPLTVPDLRSPSGDPLPVDALIASLRGLAPPPPQPVPAQPQPTRGIASVG